MDDPAGGQVCHSFKLELMSAGRGLMYIGRELPLLLSLEGAPSDKEGKAVPTAGRASNRLRLRCADARCGEPAGEAEGVTDGVTTLAWLE